MTFAVNAGANFVTPNLTKTDQVCARIYYAVTAPIDVIQTIIKLTKAVLASATSGIFFCQYRVLNESAVRAWEGVGFSLTMTFCSIMGLISPRNAYLEKVKIHFENRALNMPLYVGIDNQNRVERLVQKVVNFGGLIESGFRFYVCMGSPMSLWKKGETDINLILKAGFE